MFFYLLLAIILLLFKSFVKRKSAGMGNYFFYKVIERKIFL